MRQTIYEKFGGLGGSARITGVGDCNGASITSAAVTGYSAVIGIGFEWSANAGVINFKSVCTGRICNGGTIHTITFDVDWEILRRWRVGVGNGGSIGTLPASQWIRHRHGVHSVTATKCCP